MSVFDAVVVGAGAAGLAAAGTLRAAGCSVALVEAHHAIGGRARTVAPPALRGARIDDGATWLHQIDHNPLVALARAAGDPLHEAHRGGRSLFVDDRLATAAEQADYERAESGWRARAAALLSGPDRALSAVGDADAADPWLPNLEMWEGSIIAAADAESLSLRDWNANQLAEPDLRPDGGVGALLCRHLAGPAGPARCGVRVRTIDWSRPGRVLVDTDAGRIESLACLVTVSTGVLRDGRIGFVPALPEPQRAALDGLPMGLLSKLALPVAPGARFALPDGTLLEPRLDTRTAPAMLLSLRPDDSPLLTGFLGGRHAWSYAGRERDALHELRQRFATLLGDAALHGIGGDGHASRWGSDPLFLGSYAYARPGHAGARAALRAPFADGRVLIAGEATHTGGLAGTVGGAIAEGARAAAALLPVLGASPRG